MAKEADRYFKEAPWSVREEGFDPAHGMVAESVFSLANEFMGVRGSFEEGYSGNSLRGSYFGGVYEAKYQDPGGYRGIADTTEFMVNSVDWLYTRLEAAGERLDLAEAKVRDFSRELDLRTGLLTRRFVWTLRTGQEIEVTFERLVSMEQVAVGAQRITLKPLDFAGEVELCLGLDGTVTHGTPPKSYWKEVSPADGPERTGTGCGEADRIGADHPGADIALLELETVTTGQKVCSAIRVTGEGLGQAARADGPKRRELVYRFSLEPGRCVTAERIAGHAVLRGGGAQAQYETACAQLPQLVEGQHFDALLASNRSWWGRVWGHCDIAIEGDDRNQQGIRFCIFQLFQTYNGTLEGSNIGAKGLTGEAYNGNAFWDTETYCLPFFLFNNLKAARSLLLFRYRTLDAARARARELDCSGAFYPIATISGKECCNLWQHASLQLQASTGVAYGIWAYLKLSGDTAFLADYGLEMLIEICRMLATRGDYSADGSSYGFYGVMGPDEFQMMVSHDCYTNYMGRFTFNFTLTCIDRVEQKQPDAWRALREKLGVREEERTTWKDMADRMLLLRRGALYEQQRGFFELPHVEVNRIPVEDFPLYSHWTYDRIYRNDMIKQPDVLMLMLLFNGSFTGEELRENYAYYEPRCIHESSLSPSVHSILAEQIGREEEAFDFFRFATRMDLDNYNRNSGEGIHTTSIAAAWMNIVYGFGGLRSDGAVLSLAPKLPRQWKGYTFRLHYAGDVLTVRVTEGGTTVEAAKGCCPPILLYGETVQPAPGRPAAAGR